MKKRDLLLIAVTLAACVATFGIRALNSARPGPSWTNYMRIQDRMTFEDAERILGRATTSNKGAEGERNVAATWIAKDKSVFVIAFLEDRTVVKQWYDSNEITILDEFRRRLNLD